MEFYEHRLLPVNQLQPYDKNSRTHTDEQVEQLINSINEFGFTNPVLIDEKNGIIAGHARVLAAKNIGLDEVPTIVCSGLSDSQKKALVIADNQLALNAGWDYDILKTEIEALQDSNFDIELLGFDDSSLDEILGGISVGSGGDFNDSDGNYSRKIEAPIYEPTGAMPAVSDLSDESKTNELKADINTADIPEDVRLFLLSAAERHTVFDFSQIAEYYAHAGADVQRLMEDSALVIIDFDRAIENGFVKMSESIRDEFASQYDAE